MIKEAKIKIEGALGRKFEDGEFPLGRFGRADACISFGKNGYLLLEYENRQNHPSTNVAKLWPWLEE